MDSEECEWTDAEFKENFETQLFEYEQQHKGSQRKPWTKDRILELISHIKNGRVTMNAGVRRTSMEYYWMSKYDIIDIDDEECLIIKRKSKDDKMVRIIPREQYFDLLKEIHSNCGHGGRDKVSFNIKNQFYIPKKAIEIFVSLCPACKNKRCNPKKVTKECPNDQVISQNFNIRGQVDLMDFQPDGIYRWLLIYQDNATKFMYLRPLKSQRTREVALELMKLFLTFGAPYILQSDIGIDFVAKVIAEINKLWPHCKIIQGSPNRAQISETAERNKQDIKNSLQTWMSENNSTNWSVGCYFVQYQKNSLFDNIIYRTPYKAVFGSDPQAGLSGSAIPSSILANIKTEEQLRKLSDQEVGDGTISEQDSNNDIKYELSD